MMRSLPIAQPPVDSRGSGLMVAAIAGVLRNAQDGELPLFSWTLGLPQAQLAALVKHCFPELGRLELMPEPQYAVIVDAAPGEFRAATVRNVDAWYAAFQVPKAARLYLTPEARVRVW